MACPGLSGICGDWVKGMPALSPQAVAISGASGAIGTALIAHLQGAGYQARRLVRCAPVAQGAEVRWDPEVGTIDAAGLEGVTGVVHLAGQPLAGRRWSARYKRRLVDSRVRGTRVLCEALATLKPAPRVLLSASAIGYYGDRGDELLDEDSDAGATFLADLCEQWEAATAPAAAAGIRVVTMRMGIVLAVGGGILPRMLPAFRLAIGGPIGSGAQWLSWIGIDDLVAAMEHLLRCSDVAGPVNMVSPQPVTNAGFTGALAKAVNRPARLRLPASLVKVAMGQMGQELLLSSTRVLPSKLQASGFRFSCPSLESALGTEIGKLVGGHR